MSEPQLNEIIAVIAAERVAAGARYADLVAARQRAYRRHAAAKGLLTRARKDGSAARIAAAARREAEASADADRIGDACLREMHDLVGAALGNLLRSGQMGQAWAAGAAVTGAPGRPRPPRDGEDDADARRQVPVEVARGVPVVTALNCFDAGTLPVLARLSAARRDDLQR